MKRNKFGIFFFENYFSGGGSCQKHPKNAQNKRSWAIFCNFLNLNRSRNQKTIQLDVFCQSLKLTTGFNPIHDGLFRGCSRMGGEPFWPPLPKIRHTYPKMMKPDTVIPYLRKIQKIYKSRDIPWVLLTSAFLHRKSANFATSRNTHIDRNLIDNF